MSSTKKKTRTLIVRRSQPLEAEKPMKQIVVARAPRPGEELLAPMPNAGAPVRIKGVRRDDTGRPIERSILGTVEVFTEVEADEAPDPYLTEAPAAEAEPLSPLETADARAPPAAARGSKPGSADPSAERLRYLGRLKTGMAAAAQATKDEAREEAEYAEQLPASERFSLDRDGKVMARWQERQKDWERLQRGLARKMGKDPSKMMMSDSNDFRERLEEYQTVLASVPLHERNLGTLWEMSLRSGGTRLVPVGNIFSGLFCPVSADVHLPRIVRRPKLPSAQALLLPPAPPGKSWRNDHALVAKKRHLRKHLSAMRPHEITPEVSSALVVVGQDLLKWAHDSSRDHFEGRSGTASLGQAFVASEGRGAASAAGGSVGGASVVTDDGSTVARGPRVHLGPSPYVLLEASVKEPVEGALTLQNMGTTTLFYEWTRLEEESPSLVNVTKRRTAEGVVPSDPSARFAISKDAAESRFLCQNASGVLMPGQAKATVFAFESATPGSFAETWKLKVTPPATVLGEILPSTGGLVTVSLLGAAMATDTNEHRRLPIRQAMERSVARSECEQLVAEVVREVKTPVRHEDMRMAEKIKFESLNVEAGLNYTPLIYEAFANLWVKVNRLAGPEPDAEDDDEPLGAWDGDVLSIRRVVDGMFQVATSVAESTHTDASPEASGTEGQPSEAASEEEEEDEDEEESDEEKEEEGEGSVPEGEAAVKSGVEGAAVAIEGGAGEATYAAEDEDEEEGEEEEAAEELLEPAQAAQQEADLEWKLLVARSAARPLPTMASLIVDHVCRALADAVVDAVEGARLELQAEAGQEPERFPPLPSPFGPFFVPVDAPTHGAAKWQAVHDAPAGGGDVSAELRYRALSYGNASNAIGELIGSFSEVAAAVHADALASFARGAAAHDLARVACLRASDDVAGKRVVAVVDLDVGADMISDPFQGDAFGVPEGPKPPKLLAAAKLARKVLKHGPHTLVLLSELTPPPPEAGDEKHPVPALGDLSLRSLEPMLAALLKVPVAFCASVAALEEVLARPDDLRPKVALLDHCAAFGMAPLPEAEVVYESEPEDDRLPWLGDPRDDPSLKPRVPPARVDLGRALLPFVDVLVCDTATSACLDPARSLAALRAPDVLRVAGPRLHKELAAAAVLLHRPKRPLLAVVCGDDLLDEVKHIDRMLDVADAVAIAGRIGLVFLAALGHKTGALKHDPAQLPMARALLAKAQMLGVPVTLPVDFVMGDVLVNAFDPTGGAASMHGDEEATGGSVDEEPAEEGEGFDYAGETLECTVSEGLMRKMHALDLGNQTLNLLKELVEKSNTVVWTGLVGVAQCAAFQNGSRELMEAVVAAHEDRNALVVLGGRELVKWGALFADLDHEGPEGLGDGNGVTHAFKNLDLAKRLLAMVPVPGVELLATREPTETEAMLEEEVRAKRLMDGAMSEDGDEDDEDGAYDDDGEFGNAAAEDADY